ncbi:MULTISPECIES: BlaI/MecI/CopY family transcriptional regulator [Clostridium]|uniref:Penicillinase repressor n=1 Tax=Clostridium butyricum TaxID=1492 RepID=A0A6N2YLW6_CLOBU|nr:MULTISPECIES: BlaI/MecI/CopY family transcriptional regulator [Clostridium]MBS4842291.1 BlaI/MecI/CopY family transcriptional regulator [Clostridium sp.]MDB2137543.1 BlaI/MecI/CopY family transcriptional regulator [Clostridium butyricum]MDI9207205.1 BlaI/MecI/CopY family transcriptional regulator [Clostridium butyricum]MDU1116907.1 BlaI/MecI/CopY family transcriptional regulator [Clostridium sp.]MDU1402525.1 BlaI/MecI/CopY family transcriptional regulator [Clostridium sp.]
MTEIPKISESEWEVMKLLWNKSPLTSEEIISSLSEDKKWTKQTVKTFIIRLTKKAAIGYEKEGRIYKYYPLVDEKDCRKYENKSFLQKVYSGSLGVLLSNFLEEETLSTNEIEELERILKEKKEENLRDN